MALAPETIDAMVRWAKDIQPGETVSIVGSRCKDDSPEDREAVEAMVRFFVRCLPNDCTVLSGGAIGVDSWAGDEADNQWIGRRDICPRYELYGKTRAPLERNTEIAAKCDRHCFAFGPHDLTRGTADTLIKALRYKKACAYFRLSRCIEGEELVILVESVRQERVNKERVWSRDSPEPTG